MRGLYAGYRCCSNGPQQHRPGVALPDQIPQIFPLSQRSVRTTRPSGGRLRSTVKPSRLPARKAGSCRSRSCSSYISQLRQNACGAGALPTYFAHAMTRSLPRVSHCVRTLRLKVMAEGLCVANAAAAGRSIKCGTGRMRRPSGRAPVAAGKWLSAYDLESPRGRRAGSNTSARNDSAGECGVATRRRQFKKAKLRWRVSRGARARSVGAVKRRRSSAKAAVCVCGQERCGCSRPQRLEVWCSSAVASQDAVGDWWLSVASRCGRRAIVLRNPRSHRSGSRRRSDSDGAEAEAGRFYAPRAADRPSPAPWSSSPKPSDCTDVQLAPPDACIDFPSMIDTIKIVVAM